MRIGILAAFVLVGFFAQALSAQGAFALRPTSANTELLYVATAPFSVLAVGMTGRPALASLEHQPRTGVLFAAGGNQDGGNLYTLDSQSGTATLVGPTGFNAVPGLCFALDGALYGTATIAGGGIASNGLIAIDPWSGAATVVGSFGLANGLNVQGLEDLAVDPFSGNVLATTNFNFDGTPGDLFSVDLATGQATFLGSLVESGLGVPLAVPIAGLSFDRSGQLFGSLGNGDGRIVSIDRTALTFSVIGDAANGSVSDLSIDHRPAVDSGGGKPGQGGTTPTFRAGGRLVYGDAADFVLAAAAPLAPAYAVVGNLAAPQTILDGLLVPSVDLILGPYFTDPAGSIVLSVGGGAGPLDFFVQWAVYDAAASGSASLSNALAVTIRN